MGIICQNIILCLKNSKKRKKLGLTGNQYVQKLIEEGKLPNPTDVKREEHIATIKNAGFDNNKDYKDFLAERRGFNDNAEYEREWAYDTWRQSPMSKNRTCPLHIGRYIGEENMAKQILYFMFEEYKIMAHNNYGFDYICKNPRQEFLDRYPIFKFLPDKEYCIDVKTRHIEQRIDGWSGHKFAIDHNHIPDYFLLIGLNHSDEEKVDIMHIWLFKKDEVVRGIEFWKFISFSITNKPRKILELSTYELKYELEKLKNK